MTPEQIALVTETFNGFVSIFGITLFVTLIIRVILFFKGLEHRTKQQTEAIDKLTDAINRFIERLSLSSAD